MMGSKLSVAMAVYQGEKYLPLQIDSILPQLGPMDELVISYDQSTDRTLEIIEGYAKRDARVRVLQNDCPGVTGNFNHAVSHCTGDYIYIADQDDKWAEGKVERVQRCFREEHVDLVIHNGTHTDSEPHPIGTDFFTMYRIGDGKIKNIMKPRYSGCCMAFTKRMQQIILPMPEIHGYDQWIATVCEFWGKIAYPKEILIDHRLHGNNVTGEQSRPLPIILRMRTRLIFNLIARYFRELKRKRSKQA